MGLVQNLVKRIPSSHNLEKLPSISDVQRQAERVTPSLAFFKRRIRLRGNSKISIPLGVVLLFPCFVIILILILVVRHPSNAGQDYVAPGAPPSIRYDERKDL
jgi:mannosyltransferase